MKKLVCSLLFLMLVAFLASACKVNVLRGEGAKGEITPAVAPFNAVDVDISTKVIINMKEGAQPGIVIAGYENIIGHIKTKVENNELKVYNDLDGTWAVDYNGLTLTITMPAITLLTMTGAANADIHGNLTGKEFKIDVSGASSVKMDSANVDDLSVDISGAGNITVNGGSVKNASYEVSGASNVKAFPLQTLATKISVSGAGNGEVTATQKLDAEVSGASKIKYKGHPAITQSVSGVSSLKDAN